MPTHLAVDPDAIVAAATELDALASRIEAAAAAHSASSRVVPAGAEEVSVLAAGHFNRSAAQIAPPAAAAVSELRLAAQAFRHQAAAYRGADAAEASTLAMAM